MTKWRLVSYNVFISLDYFLSLEYHSLPTRLIMSAPSRPKSQTISDRSTDVRTDGRTDGRSRWVATEDYLKRNLINFGKGRQFDWQMNKWPIANEWEKKMRRKMRRIEVRERTGERGGEGRGGIREGWVDVDAAGFGDVDGEVEALPVSGTWTGKWRRGGPEWRENRRMEGRWETRRLSTARLRWLRGVGVGVGVGAGNNEITKVTVSATPSDAFYVILRPLSANPFSCKLNCHVFLPFPKELSLGS